MKAHLLQANALSIPLAAGSVHMVVTSPPYWSLRDYGTSGQLGLEPLHDCLAWARGDEPCGACYVCNMRAVFAEVWRVLRDDGTLWLNLGDSYNGSGGAGGDYAPGGLKAGQPKYPGHRGQGLKAKDLVGIPWRVALALQSDGWYLRSEIIWAKRAPMPESVTDRPTKAHEQIFLLTKNGRYFYDADAVREAHVREWDATNGGNLGSGFHKKNGGYIDADRTYPMPNPAGRNQRDVWTLGPEPYAGAHFATFVTEIPRRAIKAGTSERGCCPKCGKGWERVTSGERVKVSDSPRYSGCSMRNDAGDARHTTIRTTTGFRPACTCDAGDPIPCTVLDPFNGSGTTGAVAQELGRRYVGLDLSAEYLQLARDRIGMAAWDEWQTGRKVEQVADYGPLFAAAQD